MPYYQIQFKGQLDPTWEEYFDPLRLTHTPDGTSLLEGTLVDQASLYGILNQISRLNLRLISVNSLERKIDSNESN